MTVRGNRGERKEEENKEEGMNERETHRKMKKVMMEESKGTREENMSDLERE